MTAKKDLQVLVAQHNKTVIIGHNLTVDVGNTLLETEIEPIALVIPGKDFDMQPVVLRTKEEIIKAVKVGKYYVPSIGRIRAAAKQSSQTFKAMRLAATRKIKDKQGNEIDNPLYDGTLELNAIFNTTSLQFFHRAYLPNSTQNSTPNTTNMSRQLLHSSSSKVLKTRQQQRHSKRQSWQLPREPTPRRMIPATTNTRTSFCNSFGWPHAL
jgi:hypothetical protein